MKQIIVKDNMEIEIIKDKHDERKVGFHLSISGHHISHACTYFDNDGKSLVVSHMNGGYPLLTILEKQNRDVIIIRNKIDSELIKRGYKVVPANKNVSRIFYKKTILQEELVSDVSTN